MATETDPRQVYVGTQDPFQAVASMERLVASLSKQKDALDAQVKERRNILAALETDVKIARYTADKQIAEAVERTEARKRELQVQIKPLDELVKQVQAKSQQLGQLEEQHQNRMADLREAHQKQMTVLDTNLANKTKQLESLTEAVGDIKQKVAAL